MNIQLSISLLASDRAASLERCLDSLRPLLMQVPSELIVVFTGTDKRVREIAGRYTDRILPFTWCDNFSAARNVGLWAAKGEWFLYIDDDEWFEDVIEIRDFFLSGEYRKYGSACYIQKNYQDWDGIKYSDYHAFRMSRIVPGLAFQNVVHEEMTPRMMPCKYFGAYVNHYGYVSGNEKADTDKPSRNIPLLLKNIQERPSYVKNYLQIVQEYVIKKEWDKAEEYCRKGIQLCRGDEYSHYHGWLQTNLLFILCQKDKQEKAEKEALHILEKEHPNEIIRLDIYETLLMIYTRREDTENTLRYGKKFEETLAYMDQNPTLWRQQTYADITEERIKLPTRLHQIRINCVEAALKRNDTIRAIQSIKLLPWEDETWMQRYYSIFDRWKKQYAESFRELLDHFPLQSPYRLLQIASDPDDTIPDEERLELFIQCVELTDSASLQQQAVTEAVLRQLNPAGIVSFMDMDTWKQCAGNLKVLVPKENSEKLENTVEMLLRSAPVYGLWLEKLLCEEELVKGYLINDELITSLSHYVQCVLQFYKEQYRTDLFEEGKMKLLPKDCCFAVLVSKALEKMENLELAESVRLLRRSIGCYPSMTGVVREIVRQISGEARHPAQNTGTEFLTLAEQMKAAVETMYENHQYMDAFPIIVQLSALLPDDLWLLRMRQNVLRKMSESE